MVAFTIAIIIGVILSIADDTPSNGKERLPTGRYGDRSCETVFLDRMTIDLPCLLNSMPLGCVMLMKLPITVCRVLCLKE
jgi:hypothetical protein